jgi:hypothetical protein
VTAPQIAGCPIQLAQAIENRTLNAVLGITGEDNLLVRVVLRGGIEQPQNSRVNQIVQIDVNRQILTRSLLPNLPPFACIVATVLASIARSIPFLFATPLSATEMQSVESNWATSM